MPSLPFRSIAHQRPAFPRTAFPLPVNSEPFRGFAMLIRCSSNLRHAIAVRFFASPSLCCPSLCPCFSTQCKSLASRYRSRPHNSYASHGNSSALPLQIVSMPRHGVSPLFCADASHCSEQPRFAFALFGYESVTIVTPKNTEVKRKWIRKRKFGALHKRRGFVLCVSHKLAGSGA